MEINFGFQPHAHTRNKFPFSIPSVVHVSIVLIIDLFILYLNGDPRPFLRATNTTIINYGLWLQIEISLLLGECEFVSKSKQCRHLPFPSIATCSHSVSRPQYCIIQIHMATVVQMRMHRSWFEIEFWHLHPVRSGGKVRMSTHRSGSRRNLHNNIFSPMIFPFSRCARGQTHIRCAFPSAHWNGRGDVHRVLQPVGNTESTVTAYNMRVHLHHKR